MTNKNLKIIEHLWSILDDIDSQSDACKSNDKAYRERVEKLQKLRWETGITSDGFKVVLPDGTALPARTTYRL